jgi:hypothetical protein
MPTVVDGTTADLSVSATDPAGASSLTYAWSTTSSSPAGVTFSNNGTNAAHITTATFHQSGSYTFQVVVTDPGGQTATSTVSVTVEQTATSITVSPGSTVVTPGTSVQLTATTFDQFGKPISNPAVTWVLSGVGSVSKSGLYTAPATGVGRATVTASSGTATRTAAITIAKASPKITLAASSSAAVFGQTVTLVATVSGSGGNLAGTIIFYDGGKVLGTAPLNGLGTAEMNTGGLIPGGNPISARYSGDASNLGASSGVASVTVSRAATRIVFTPQEVYKKKRLVSVELLAAIQPITPGAGVPAGVVTFEVKKPRAKILGSTVLSGGSGTILIKPNRVENQVVTIIYSGDADFLSSAQTTPRLTQALLKNLARPMMVQNMRLSQFASDVLGWSS